MIIRVGVLLEREVSGYTPPSSRAFLLLLNSRITADFVHLFLKVSGEMIIYMKYPALACRVHHVQNFVALELQPLDLTLKGGGRLGRD
ncbi:MAG TPA: hypothetical protein VGL91_01790 [Acidobacteriota bacterium]